MAGETVVNPGFVPLECRQGFNRVPIRGHSIGVNMDMKPKVPPWQQPQVQILYRINVCRLRWAVAAAGVLNVRCDVIATAL